MNSYMLIIIYNCCYIRNISLYYVVRSITNGTDIVKVIVSYSFKNQPSIKSTISKHFNLILRFIIIYHPLFYYTFIFKFLQLLHKNISQSKGFSVKYFVCDTNYVTPLILHYDIYNCIEMVNLYCRHL